MDVPQLIAQLPGLRRGEPQEGRDRFRLRRPGPDGKHRRPGRLDRLRRNGAEPGGQPPGGERFADGRALDLGDKLLGLLPGQLLHRDPRVHRRNNPVVDLRGHSPRDGRKQRAPG